MSHRLDIDNWHRRHLYEFFKDYELPFFNLCADVDVTRLHDSSREDGGPSFILATLYLSLRAANEIEPFRYRIAGDSIIVHDIVHGGTTVLRQDETFGFAYFDYCSSYSEFQTVGREILERARTASGPLDARTERDDVIHTSIIPWVRFTGFAHAQKLGSRDSIPKFVFGRHLLEQGLRKMPVSVEVHHALMDGLDVGRFYELYQSLLDDPASLTT